MILQLRHGKTQYEIVVPRGSLVRRSAAGIPVLIIPGARPEDTWSWLPAPSIVAAARLGQFGMTLCAERRLAMGN